LNPQAAAACLNAGDVGLESSNCREQLAAAGGERRIGEVRDPVLADAPHLREHGGAL